MNNKFCVQGCLRLELDENGEMLLDAAEKLEDDLENQGFVSAEDLQRLGNNLRFFTADVATFRSECGQCTNFKSDGKAKQYQDIIDKMNAFTANLNQLSTEKK